MPLPLPPSILRQPCLLPPSLLKHTRSNLPRTTCLFRRLLSTRPSSQSPSQTEKKPDLYENIYTLPNLLTLSRIASCPLLGYFIYTNQTLPATLTLAYAGVSDLVRPSLRFHIPPLKTTCADVL